MSSSTTATATAEDIAKGLTQSLGDLAQSVTFSGSVVTVKVAVGADLERVRSVTDGYRDSGVTIGLDHRAGAR
ncbi:MAG TPA: hypothetical protein VIQ80_03370 [Candidatus Saccharimonadales bacterium]